MKQIKKMTTLRWGMVILAFAMIVSLVSGLHVQAAGSSSRISLSKTGISVKEGKMYISMPYYANSRDDENKDICHPIAKEFREKLNGVIMQAFEQAREKRQDTAREQGENFMQVPDMTEQDFPFR